MGDEEMCGGVEVVVVKRFDLLCILHGTAWFRAVGD